MRKKVKFMDFETALENVMKAKGNARKQDNLKFWFVPYGEGNSYFFDIFTRDLWADITAFLAKHSEEELADLLGTVGGLWDLIVHGLEAMDTLQYSEKEKRQYAFTLLKLMGKTKKDDILLETKRNTIWDNATAEKFSQTLEPIKNSQDAILKLCGALAMYTDALCNHWDCFIKELHGPYKVKKGFLFLRDFLDLKPEEIWPQTKKMPCKKLRIATLCETTDIEMDIFQHYRYLSEKPLAQDLKAFSVLEGERALSTEEIENLAKTIQGVTFGIVGQADKMAKAQKVQKYAEQLYYGLKKFRTALKKDWRPPKEVVDRINERVKE